MNNQMDTDEDIENPRVDSSLEEFRSQGPIARLARLRVSVTPW
jgi:hypothetical protein